MKIIFTIAEHAASKTQRILVISSDCPPALGDYISIKVSREALLNFTFYFKLVTDEKSQFSFFNISTVLCTTTQFHKPYNYYSNTIAMRLQKVMIPFYQYLAPVPHR